MGPSLGLEEGGEQGMEPGNSPVKKLVQEVAQPRNDGEGLCYENAKEGPKRFGSAESVGLRTAGS